MTFRHELNQNVQAVLKIMSQRELAKRAGVPQAVISRLLSTDDNQHRLPGFKTAEKLNEWCKKHLGRGPMNQIVGSDERW
jgi:predicted transcriptional regulator